MITLNDVLFRVYRNPLLQNVRKVDIVDHVKAVTQLLGLKAMFEEKSITLKIEEFRAKLPTDFYRLEGVTRMFPDGTNGIRIKATSDDRIQQYHKKGGPEATTMTYKIVPGWIYTDFDRGEIEVIYKAFMTDSSGFPVLPDSESLLLAIENYIKVSYFTILFETGHLSENVLERATRQCDWYMGQASNEFDTPTEDEAESIFDSIVRLIPDRDAFFTNFKYNSNTEKLINHD